MWSLREGMRILYQDNGVLLYAPNQSDEVHFLTKKSALLLALYMRMDKDACLQAYHAFGFDPIEYDHIQEKYGYYLLDSPDGTDAIDLEKVKYLKQMKSMSYRVDFPINIQWIATYQCGFSCVYCGVARKSPLEKEKRVDIIHIRRAFQEALDKGTRVFDIHGGDPLFQYGEEIYDIIQMLCVYGCDINLSTKGLISKERAFRLRNAGLANIQLSVDTMDQDVESQLYPGLAEGQYVRFTQSLNRLRDVGISPHVNIVITKYNYRKIPELVTELLKNEHIAVVGLSWYKRTVNNDRNFPVTRNQRLWLMEKMHPLYSSDKKRIRFDFSLDAPKSASNRLICANGRYKLLIFPDGTCGVCDFIDRDERFVAGDIARQTIQEIWDSACFQETVYRDRADFAHKKCSDCSCFDLCMARGICYADMLLQNKGQFGPDFQCKECI